MASFLDFLSGGQGGGILGNRPFYSDQTQPASAAPQSAPQGGGFLSGLSNYANDHSNMLMALAGGLASGGIGGGFQAAAKAGEAEQMQRLALAHFLQQKSQFEQELAMKKYLTSPEYLGQTEEQKAQIAQKYKSPIVVPYGAELANQTGQMLNPEAGGMKQQAKSIADAIEGGRQPPTLTGVDRRMVPMVRSELEGRGFNLSNATLQYEGAHKQVLSLNGPQMMRYVGLTDSVDRTIDEVRDLSKQMQLSGIPALNKLELAAYTQAQGNTPNGQLATRYITAINTLKEEFANLAQGGYAPTEPAWRLAEQQINGNYGDKQLDASLTEAQRLIRYRKQAIPNLGTLGPGVGNQYVPGSGQPAATTAPAQAAPAGATQAPQTAPSGPQEGDIAVNRSTGQRMQLKGGKWMPAPQPGQQQL